jgi:hypothetical protein
MSVRVVSMFTKRLDRIHENYAKICKNFAVKELVENLQRNDKKCKNANLLRLMKTLTTFLPNFCICEKIFFS